MLLKKHTSPTTSEQLIKAIKKIKWLNKWSTFYTQKLNTLHKTTARDHYKVYFKEMFAN